MNKLDIYLSEFERNFYNPSVDLVAMIPDKKGLYLICIKDAEQLPNQFKNVEFTRFQGREVLYVGISGNRGLRKRDYQNHFVGSARTSTLRKSLGVLFNFPKVHTANERGTIKYKFDKESELRLNQWMRDNLMMHFCITDDKVEDIESKLIELFNPPLNISKNKNKVNKEFRLYLSQLRCSIG